MIYTNDWLGNFAVHHGDRVTFTEPDCLTRTGKANGLLMFSNYNRFHMVPPCNVSPEDTKQGLDILDDALGAV